MFRKPMYHKTAPLKLIEVPQIQLLADHTEKVLLGRTHGLNAIIRLIKGVGLGLLRQHHMKARLLSCP